ncbi:breast cancer type 2 susceptibility protein-like isoform X5 [Aphis gossypii]|uniref:breast cancer type 2 susceptibility protein-like isoform X5 n=1 Tax=Aphis gossypii TaxID=80765 RepID=UPI002158BDBB|nr:breast cancer type 2 susceptibility protein-like isoform X5 [Aphis gossypii]
MEKQNKSHEMKQNLRAKSPTVKSALQDCSILNISNPHNLNSIKKENQEMKVLTVSTPTIHQPKTLKNLNLLSNLQSTPNTRHFNKSEMDSRIIMNLSPIMSTSTLKQNLYNHKDIYQHKSHTDIDFSLNPLKYQNSSNLCKNHELNKWKTNKTLIGTTHKSNIINSTILPENTRQTNEDNINEKAKRCLFEENKTVNNISNLETDQDSLNISLDILEQVCQMSEIMDDSLTEEVKINVDNDKKKKKLAFFLYGNSTPKLEDTEEENKLLQWALSMEDNVLSESRSNNKLCSEKEFTSLNQLKNKETNLSKYGSEQSKSNKLNTYISDSKCNFFDPEDINEIGNTQMCEIADMTEPLESFDDQWTQQYTSCNVSNLSSKVKENHFHKNSDEVINTSIDFIGDKINIKKCNLLDNTNEKLEIFQSIVKNELIESRIVTPDDIITNDSIYNGFFTAGGKLIKVSDEALQKVQTLLKDELTESSTVTKGTTSTKTNTCKGFSTAGGKSIKISDTALQKVQTLLKDELTESSTVTKGTTSSKTNICKGFSTAGGKSIKISDTALQKVQTLLKDELTESSTVPKGTTSTKTNTCKGFSTAGGKSIKISDTALQKAQTLLKDELTESSTVTKGTTSSKTNTCKGFSTAGGKSIKISDTALQKAQTLLKDELTESSTVTKGTTSSKTNTCKGFSTAGGKSIKISDTALQKAQTLLKDELTESSTVPKSTTSTKTNTCKGFSTAGGKSIKISDTALQKAQTLLKDELTESSTVPKGTTSSKTNTCKGFSTAGGKSIKISDTALQKVQTLLKDELTESSTVTKGTTSSKTNTCKGFSTAGGKSIKISDTALQKVQTLLKDELTESSTVPKGTTSTKTNTCKGFSTAGGKSIKISDTALQKVQTMLKDELTESSTVTKDTTSSKTKIFNQLLNAEDKSIKKLDMLLQKDQVTYKDDKQLFDSSLKTIDIPNDCNNLNRASKSINNLKTKSNCFEILKHEEENTFEDDLSLINTVEKFERDQIVCKPVLRNKRPGSPINKYEIDYKIKKTVHNERWEIDELNISFNDYLSKKLYGPKVSLPEVVDWNLPKMSTTKQFPENGIAKELIKLGIDNATNLKLYWEKNYKLSDGHKNKMYNFQDIKYFFLLHNFVDGKLIPNRWIENHFRFIVWKLAATEIFFPDQFGNKLLTAKNIIHQLLYRYYREIEKCQRSALKKILEKDEATSKRIVLCVSKVNKTNLAETYTIELTDGWYSVQGIIDYEMNMLLHKGIVKVGTKLIVYNAELIGAGEGIDPLDVHNGVKLKISTNSTRRVRWYTKLGFYKNSTLPIPITLESVLPHGGIIGSLSLVILRKYPIMFLEKKTSSKSIFRNEKMEIIEAEKYKAHQQKALEIISNNIKSELIAEMASKTNSVSKKYISNMKKENLDTLNIDELSNILENSTDPLEIQSLLSQEKLEALEDFKKSEQERFYNELQNRVNKVFNDQFKDARKVIPMIKLRVVDKKYASTGVKAALLTIWNPSEDVTDILNKSTEGQCCTFHHITANGFMNGELQLSANKNTRFNFQECTNEYAKRDVVSFKNIWSGTFLPLFGELDFVGIVISNVNKNNAFNEVYVSDKEMNIISILFRGNIKEYGYDDMIYPGSILSGINIQFKGFNPMSSIPKLYTTEQSLFTTNPKTDYILNIFNDYKMFIKMPENQDFLVSCQTKLNEICNGHGETTMINNEQCLNKSRNALHRSYGELPVTVVRTSNTPQSEFSPVQKRIKMLNAYGKTPPLNIVHTKPPDKKLMGQFKTPTRL